MGSSSIVNISKILDGGFVGPGIEVGVKEGQRTVEINSADLVDKVINLRLIHKATGPGVAPRTFTIRSDYEIQWLPGGGWQYIDCIEKPQIKITYKNVSDSIAVQLSIEVVNLYVGDELLYLNRGEPIEAIEVQVGYKAQFPDWVRDEAFSRLPVEQFYAMKDYLQVTAPEKVLAPTRLIVQVLSTHKTSMPPDSLTVFNCVIGTLDRGLRLLVDMDTLDTRFLRRSTAAWLDRVPANSLPYLFLDVITRRFIRTSVRHQNYVTPNDERDSVTETDDPVYQGVSVSQSVTVYDSEYEPVEVLELEYNGLMGFDDANKYGVIVYISDMLWETPIDEMPQWDLTDRQLEQMLPIEQLIMPTMHDRIIAQLLAISEVYTFIRYYQLPDGNFKAYHVDETIDDLMQDTVSVRQQQRGLKQIPAVYDITWGGLTEIKCPFYTFLAPTDVIAFRSRYIMNETAGFFITPGANLGIFKILLGEITFSTTGEENMMVLRGIIARNTPDFVESPDGSVKRKLSEVTEVAKAQQQRNEIVWRRRTLAVVGGVITDDNNTTTWAATADRMVASATAYEKEWVEENGSLPGRTEALTLLQDDNPGLFTNERLTRVQPLEIALIQETGIQVPVLYGPAYQPSWVGSPDEIIIREPFLPTVYYSTAKEIG